MNSELKDSMIYFLTEAFKHGGEAYFKTVMDHMKSENKESITIMELASVFGIWTTIDYKDVVNKALNKVDK